MGDSSKPNFQAPPHFQPFPTVEPDINLLSQTGRGLIGGDFLNPDDPALGFLNQLVTLNPEASQQAFGLATRDIVELRDRAQQDVLNQLEANNQLTSSTTVNRLSDLNEAFSSDIADVATTIQLADVERSLGNIGQLFQLGLGTTETAVGLGQTQQSQTNSFALERFDREQALEAERFSRQLANEAATARTVGFFTGPVGGAVFGGIQSGGQGAQAGLGGGLELANLLFQGAGTFGGGGGFGTPNTIPTSSNNDFGLNQRLLLQQQRASRGVA